MLQNPVSAPARYIGDQDSWTKRSNRALHMMRSTHVVLPGDSGMVVGIKHHMVLFTDLL